MEYGAPVYNSMISTVFASCFWPQQNFVYVEESHPICKSSSCLDSECRQRSNLLIPSPPLIRISSGCLLSAVTPALYLPTPVLLPAPTLWPWSRRRRRVRGKLLRDHTGMGPKLESGVYCQQHSGGQSRGSKNKQWKSKPEVLFLQIRFLGKKKNVETSKFHENKHFVYLFCFQLVALSVCFKKKESHGSPGCQSTFNISGVLLLFTFSSYSIRSHKTLFT